MSQLEIYFIGLITFINEADRYTRAEVLWDEDLEHVPFVYLGPTAGKIKNAVPLKGELSFRLPGGGPSSDNDPESPAIHLKQWITGSPKLRTERPLAATVELPSGVFGVAAQLNDATVKLRSTTRVQAVSQIALVSCPATSAAVEVLMNGQVIDTVDASSFVLIGNMSREHDSDKFNHFTKYIRLTQGGTEIATVTAPPDPFVGAGAYPGNNYDKVVLYIMDKFPRTKTFGAPDCTITQWP